MNTSMVRTNFPSDGPCCGGNKTDVVNYLDHGNTWVMQGDIEPGTAWAYANSSGLTINDQTCPTYAPGSCTPHHEYFGDKEPFFDTAIQGDLAVPSAATVFSIEAYLPYHSYYSSCSIDSGSGGSGCTYIPNAYQQLLYTLPYNSPYDAATFAYAYNSNLVVVNIAEICSSASCTNNSLLMTAYTSYGGVSVVKMLANVLVPTFTPLHKLTIATDTKTFIDIYVDNTLLYSNSSMPISGLAPGGDVEFAARTSINNETNVVVWSNYTAYASPFVTVQGLSSGMTVLVNGTAGFKGNATASAGNGTVLLNVAPEPENLSISIELNGQIIATINSVESGAVLDLSTS
jgi:hypothetical protein